MYATIPWTLDAKEPKILKEKKEEIQLKEIQNKLIENLPVSAARIITFLNKNKNKCFTNKQIAAEIGISTSSVSGIMDKLEEIGCVKVAKIKKGLNSGISQVYQSYDGSSAKVEKEREVEGCIVKVLAIFEKNVNKTYSTSEIAQLLHTSKNSVSSVISILLATDKIKLVDKKEAIMYQHIKGNKLRVPVCKEPDKNYVTLKDYLKMNGIKKCPEELKEELNKEKNHSRLFQSNQGIIKEYEVSYLQKVIKFDKIKEEKKGLLERIKVW